MRCSVGVDLHFLQTGDHKRVLHRLLITNGKSISLLENDL